MKRFFIASIWCLSLLVSCRYHNNHDIKISVNESTGRYTFYASFPKQKTGKVHSLINHHIAPNGLFGSAEDYMNITTQLKDNTNFAVKASPGIIEISIDREGNSPASYSRIKEMCMDIKNALKD